MMKSVKEFIIKHPYITGCIIFGVCRTVAKKMTRTVTIIYVTNNTTVLEEEVDNSKGEKSEGK